MDSIVELGIALVGLVSAIAISAVFWRRVPALRKLSFYYCIVIGFIYLSVRKAELDWLESLEVIAGFGLVGLILYFGVWIECRDKKDGFL